MDGTRNLVRTQKATARCRNRLVDALQLGFADRSETCQEGRTSEGARRAVVV